MYETLLNEQIDVRRPVQDCFRYLLDFSTAEQWDPGVYRAEKLTPGPVRLGSEFRLVLSGPGRRTVMHYRLTGLSLGESLHLTGVGDGVLAEDSIRFLPLEAGRTRISYAARLRFPGLGGLSGQLLQPMLTRLGRRAVAGLRIALDEARPGAHGGGSPTLSQRLLLPAAIGFTERGYLAMPRKAHSRFMDGKTVLITGPTSGIGLAAACEIARLGARLILVGRHSRKLEAAAEVIEEFAGMPSGLRLIEADLSEPGQLERAAREVLLFEPRLDVLVNNAGVLLDQRELTSEGQERSMATNLLAPLRLARALMPLLARSQGRVINVSSGGQYLQALGRNYPAAKDGRFNGIKAYAEAKRALVSANASLAARHPDVAFHAMHPGWVATPGVTRSLPRFERVMKRYLRDARMGADTIVWLASEDAALLGTGNFWLDRRIQPTDVLPTTVVAPERARQLMLALDSILEPAAR